jgi:hypothetical protein
MNMVIAKINDQKHHQQKRSAVLKTKQQFQKVHFFEVEATE